MNRRRILCLMLVVALGLPTTLLAAKKKRKPNAEPAGTPTNPSAPPGRNSITIQGFVYKNTKPIAGAKVQLKKLRHTGRQRAVRGGSTSRSNADGHFAFRAAPGAYAVVASKKGLGTAHVRTVLTAGEGLGQLRLFLNHPHRHCHRPHRQH